MLMETTPLAFTRFLTAAHHEQARMGNNEKTAATIVTTVSISIGGEDKIHSAHFYKCLRLIISDLQI